MPLYAISPCTYANVSNEQPTAQMRYECPCTQSCPCGPSWLPAGPKQHKPCGPCGGGKPTPYGDRNQHHHSKEHYGTVSVAANTRPPFLGSYNNVNFVGVI
jgi:hypothetical protein